MSEVYRESAAESALASGRRLEGKVALVTGGDRSIGRATALRLADEGADVCITYREREDAAADTKAELESKGVRAADLQVDLTGTDEIDGFVSAFRETLSGWDRGDFDILVNNAGVLRLGPFPELSKDDVETVWRVNYESVFFLTQSLLDSIVDGGRIVNLGSGTAGIAFSPLVSYGPSKAAVESLTLYLASDLGSRGITVNAVSPGGLDDDFNAELFEQMPGAKDFISSGTALGRLGTPEDIAPVIAFLCSSDAGFITGARIDVSGGFHL